MALACALGTLTMNVLSAFALLAAAAAWPNIDASRPGPLPISAHNCYPHDGQGQDRLREALRLGIDNIEIDVGWDAHAHRLVVGHEARPRPGVAYPELEAYLVPALEAHWKSSRSDGAPTILTIDWKTSEPDAVRRFHTFLEAHANWFSSAPKAAKSPMTLRRLTVCLTGSDTAKDLYDSLIPAGGTYRAFREIVYGAGLRYHPEVSFYLPKPADAYQRFLTIYWGHVEHGGPPLAGEWTEVNRERLSALVSQAHHQGYRVRVYTLNGHSGTAVDGYRFADDSAARARWRAARNAGADWIATDEYAEIVKYFQEMDLKTQPRAPATPP